MKVTKIFAIVSSMFSFARGYWITDHSKGKERSKAEDDAISPALIQWRGNCHDVGGELL